MNEPISDIPADAVALNDDELAAYNAEALRRYALMIGLDPDTLLHPNARKASE